MTRKYLGHEHDPYNLHRQRFSSRVHLGLLHHLSGVLWVFNLQVLWSKQETIILCIYWHHILDVFMKENIHLLSNCKFPDGYLFKV